MPILYKIKIIFKAHYIRVVIKERTVQVLINTVMVQTSTINNNNNNNDDNISHTSIIIRRSEIGC